MTLHALRIAAVVSVAAALSACGTTGVVPYTVDAHVRSTPDTVVMGELPAGRKPVLTIQSGQAVRIDTISHQGLASGMDPVKFFSAAGIPANEVLKDAMDVYPMMAKRPKEAGAHVLTGPIYVEGAEPGDMLEVRVRDIDFRVPYGVMSDGRSGVEKSNATSSASIRSSASRTYCELKPISSSSLL